MSTRIYVACLAAYNNGTLHGVWIDDLDMFEGMELQQRIGKMLASSPEPSAEEWAIHDHEGFGSYRVSEWHDLQELCDVARLIDEHGAEVASIALEYTTTDQASVWVEDHYEGKYARIEDWADSWLEDTGTLSSIPENLRYYFDVTSWARDAQLGGDIFTEDCDGGVHVFHS